MYICMLMLLFFFGCQIHIILTNGEKKRKERKKVDEILLNLIKFWSWSRKTSKIIYEFGYSAGCPTNLVLEPVLSMKKNEKKWFVERKWKQELKHYLIEESIFISRMNHNKSRAEIIIFDPTKTKNKRSCCYMR